MLSGTNPSRLYRPWGKWGRSLRGSVSARVPGSVGTGGRLPALSPSTAAPKPVTLDAPFSPESSTTELRAHPPHTSQPI